MDDPVACADEITISRYVKELEVQCLRKQWLASPERDRGNLHPDLVKQSRIGKLTGEVIVNHARDVGFDKQSGTLVLLTATEILGLSESGWIWSHPSPEQATLHGIGSGLAYFRDGGPHFVLDLSDGSLATPEFQGAPASAAGPFLPTHTTERGAAIVENGPIRYLVTRD